MDDPLGKIKLLTLLRKLWADLETVFLLYQCLDPGLLFLTKNVYA